MLSASAFLFSKNIKLIVLYNWITYEEKLMKLWIIIFVLILSFLGFASPFTMLIVKWLQNRKNRTIGFKFEKVVNQELAKLAKKYQFQFIHGNTYHYDGKLFEMDGMLLFSSFIIGVEIKYYEGLIEGDASSNQLKITHDKVTNEIKNPLIQVDRHLTHLESLTRRNDIPLGGLIILPEVAQINIQNVPNHAILTTFNQLEATLLQLSEQAIQLPPKIDVKELEYLLESMQAKTRGEQKIFQELINKKKEKKGKRKWTKKQFTK